MKLTMSSEMGIHAVWFLAALNSEAPVLSSLIAERIDVSESYVIKVLKRLVEARILVSRKGKKGGYRMHKLPADVSLADIILACETDEVLYSCLCTERGCEEHRQICPITDAMKRAENAMYAELRATTVADLVAFEWPAAKSESGSDCEAKEV
jgi:Rrf2 family protein